MKKLRKYFRNKTFFAGVQLDYKSDPMRKLKRRYFIRLNNIYLKEEY